jgi:TonB family protein
MRPYLLLILAFLFSPSLFGQVGSEYCEKKFSDWNEDKSLFIFYESMPKLKGGLESLFPYLYYPESDLESGIEGVVTIWFLVNEDGKPVCERVIQSVDNEIDEIALNSVRKSEFVPATVKDEPVSRAMTLPFTFSLDERKARPGKIDQSKYGT